MMVVWMISRMVVMVVIVMRRFVMVSLFVVHNLMIHRMVHRVVIR
jgi:hypothetical protein